MQDPKTNLKQVVSYIPEPLHSKLTADADASKRSISAQVHYIIEQHYEQKDDKRQ